MIPGNRGFPSSNYSSVLYLCYFSHGLDTNRSIVGVPVSPCWGFIKCTDFLFSRAAHLMPCNVSIYLLHIIFVLQPLSLLPPCPAFLHVCPLDHHSLTCCAERPTRVARQTVCYVIQTDSATMCCLLSFAHSMRQWIVGWGTCRVYN